MKNLYILPTDKPSRLYYNNNNQELQFCEVFKKSTPLKENKNIYITSDEEIKEGDWIYDILNNLVYKYLGGSNEVWNNAILASSQKIVLTIDQDLIKDGVQAIDDEFLEWFVKNPNCEFVMTLPDVKGLRDIFQPTGKNLYKLIIPKEEPKQETLEEASKKYSENWEEITGLDYENVIPSEVNKLDFINGAKWQAERMHSEEDIKNLIKIIEWYDNESDVRPNYDEKIEDLTMWEWFEQFKKK